MPVILISSGQGPAECELAVGLYLAHLQKERPTAEIVKSEGKKEVSLDSRRLTLYKSVVLTVPDGEPLVGGTILWRSKSPFRKNHGRRNWFFQVETFPDDLSLNSEAAFEATSFTRELTFATFRSPGKGGQNVNKVETGARVTHQPSGQTAVSTTARTQKANKTLAVARLKAKLGDLARRNEKAAEENLRRSHYRLERGNPALVFDGLDFRRST
jgi:peptide chain release factor